LNLQFPPTPLHLSKAVTKKPVSTKFLMAVIPDGPAPMTATFFIEFIISEVLAKYAKLDN
jgi:hypothetical protein